MKKTLLSTVISALALSSSVGVQAEGFDNVIEGSSIDFNFRFRTESVDKDNTLDSALANTLKSRLTFKSGDYAGVSVLVEGDNVFHITDDFNDGENGNAQYNKVLDQETTQFNQAYVQYANESTTVKLGNQRINLDNQRHVGGVAFRQDEQTFDAISVVNTSLANTTVVAAFANNVNNIKNDNLELDVTALNVKYQVNDQLATSGFYYSVTPDGGDTTTIVGARAVGEAAGISYEAELATQDNETNNTLYYHINGSKKLGDVKATLGYEVLGSDDGEAAFATPLGTNHKFLGWSDVFLNGADANGIQDIYASAVTKVSGVKLVGQFHHFTSDEGSDPLGNEFGFVVAKKFNNYSASLKVAQYLATDYAENTITTAKDTTKVWLTATAKF